MKFVRTAPKELSLLADKFLINGENIMDYLKGGSGGGGSGGGGSGGGNGYNSNGGSNGGKPAADYLGNYADDKIDCPFAGVTAYGISGGSYASGKVIPFRKLLHTFGPNKNVFNTGNSRFTAPITGVYKLSLAILSESTGSGSTKYTEMDWWVNGKDTNVGCLDDIQSKGHTPCLTSAILQLNKGDYVEVRSHLRT